MKIGELSTRAGVNPSATGILAGLLLFFTNLFFSNLFLSNLATARSNPTREASEILGIWEGESKCTVPDSPCRDEHVIYEIAPDKSASGALKMDGYKVVNGERQFMGTLRCEYHAPKKTLSCTSRGKNFDDWQYTLSNSTLQGTLTTDAGKTLYRRITVKKNAALSR